MSVKTSNAAYDAQPRTVHPALNQKKSKALIVMDRTQPFFKAGSCYQNAVVEATERKQDIKYSAAGKRQPETLDQTIVLQP